MTWTMLDTFSGIGGFALAAAWTGRIRPVQFIEIDPWCQRVLAKHWPEVPIHGDIRTFLPDADGATGEARDPDGIRTGEPTERLACRGLDLITGGFPCQPFSAAGKRAGARDDRYLWPELARIIRCLRPRYVLAENVPGIIGMEGGLDRVLADLGEAGYATRAFVIPAAAVGAYHRRDRVWIVAADADRRRREQRQPGERTVPIVDASDDVPDADRAGRREHGGAIHVYAELTAAECGRGERHAGPEALRGLGDAPDGLSRRLAGSRLMDPRWVGGPRHAFAPEWEEGVPRVTAHEPDRVAKLKALGNAIVPQVAYELMQMMLAVDDGVMTG